MAVSNSSNKDHGSDWSFVCVPTHPIATRVKPSSLSSRSLASFMPAIRSLNSSSAYFRSSAVRDKPNSISRRDSKCLARDAEPVRSMSFVISHQRIVLNRLSTVASPMSNQEKKTPAKKLKPISTPKPSHRGEPNRGEPNRALPNRAEPNRGLPNRGEPHRDVPSGQMLNVLHRDIRLEKSVH